MRERRRNYELMFIVSPVASADDDINAVVDRVHQSITGLNGEVTSTDRTAPWGRRKFAYPIRQYAEGEASRRAFTEGIYVLCNFLLSTSQIPELERSLKLNDSILRHMLLVVEHPTAVRPLASTSAPVALGGEDADDEDVDADDDEADDDEA